MNGTGSNREFDDMGKKKKISLGGEGSFRYRSSGSLEYRFRYKDENDEIKRKSVIGFDEEECLKKAAEWLEKIEKRKQGIDPEATIPSLLYERYSSDYEKNYMGEQGYSRNLESVKRIEKSTIGRLPIVEIDRHQLELFLRELTSYSNSVIQKIYRQVRLAFSIAKENGLIKNNPMQSREMRCPRSSREDAKIRGLTIEEQKRLEEVMLSKAPPKGRNDYRIQLFIEMYSGLRMGEINALHRQDIDLDKMLIHVRGTVSKGLKDRLFIKTGAKTSTGVRDVPVSKKLVPYLTKALNEQKDNPEDLIFYDYNKNSIIDTAQVNCYYHRICKAADVPCMGQHALRHTFATRCIESGIPAVVLKNWLGHKDIHMTLDIYTDVFNSMNNGALNQFDRYVDSI